MLPYIFRDVPIFFSTSQFVQSSSHMFLMFPSFDQSRPIMFSYFFIIVLSCSIVVLSFSISFPSFFMSFPSVPMSFPSFLPSFHSILSMIFTVPWSLAPPRQSSPWLGPLLWAPPSGRLRAAVEHRC